jgi:O-succinylbenzoate synthase
MNETTLNERVSTLRTSLSLTTPLSFLAGDGTQRDIAFVILRDVTGVPHYGEISPLPGFSVERIEDALSELDAIAFAIPPIESVSLPLSPVWTLFLRTIQCPSLRCGIEGAILDRLARSGALMDAIARRPTVPCNALIMVGEEKETLRQITDRVALGFETLKIKISPQSVESTLRALRASNLSPRTRLRLDANRSFTTQEWSSVTKELSTLPIEYIEEPVRTPEELPAIIKSGGIPIAIDETTRDTAPEEWLRWGLRAVVLKPSLNGGLLSLLPLISMIERNGAYVTLSSSFESGVGLRSLTLLTTLMDRCGPIGVDTASFIKGDLTEPSFPRSTPNIDLRELISTRYIGGNQ